MATKSSTAGKYGIGSVDAILAFDDTKTALVDIDEWQTSVKVKSLSKADELAIRKQAARGGVVDEQQFEGLLLVYGIVEPKFEKHHIVELQKKSSGPLNKIVTAILELSGMTDDSDKKAEENFRDSA